MKNKYTKTDKDTKYWDEVAAKNKKLFDSTALISKGELKTLISLLDEVVNYMEDYGPGGSLLTDINKILEKLKKVK